MTARWTWHTLRFKRPAGTSRGTLHTKDSAFIQVCTDDGRTAIGECGLLRGLSCDDRPGYAAQLDAVCDGIDEALNAPEEWADWPSIRFALEMLARDLQTPMPFHYHDSAWARGEAGIPTNGLVWMGDADFMARQMDEKLAQGFGCIKMKIGAIDLETELRLLRGLRDRFPADVLELRVDANGAFAPDEAPAILDRLAALDLHSIEQPVRPEFVDALARLSAESPLPVALDESLIGLHDPARRRDLLHAVRPAYIVLKPSLVGGWAASRDWIEAANEVGAGWWITSALESNVGLNAIAQFTATFQDLMPQGLGTGSLYENNLPAPLVIRDAGLHRTPGPWDLSHIQRLLGW